MNSMKRIRELMLAYLVTCLLGAVVGLFIGFVISLGDSSRAAGVWFSIWMGEPELFWPWPVFGGLIAGLTTCTVRAGIGA
jgi:hypothetical protein